MPVLIWDRGNVICRLRQGTFCSYKAEPGRHVFVSRSSTWSAVEADLSAGNEYFVSLIKVRSRVEVGMFNVQVEASMEMVPAGSCSEKYAEDRWKTGLNEIPIDQNKDMLSTRYSGRAGRITDSMGRGEYSYREMGVLNARTIDPGVSP